MRMEIKNESYNRFLKRKEFGVYIDHIEEATPSAAAVQQMLAKQANSAVEKTEIRARGSANGGAASKCTAYVWDEKTVKGLSKKEEAPAPAESS